MFSLIPRYLTPKFAICELSMHRKWTLTFSVVALLQGDYATRVYLRCCVVDRLLLTLCIFIITNHSHICIEQIFMAYLHPYLSIFYSLLSCTHL